MFFRQAVLEAMAGGRVDLAFRRWERPRVKPGGQQRTAVGVIGFDAVVAIDRGKVTDDDALRAGYVSRAALLEVLDRRSTGRIYRIRLRLLGPDPRIRLRDSLPDDEERREIERRLARLDRASRQGPWTRSVLEAIRDRPAVRAAELAAGFGRQTQPFKIDVRKLKELGLTESLRPGYRLSPRGRAVLEAGVARSGRSAVPEEPVEAGVGD